MQGSIPARPQRYKNGTVNQTNKVAVMTNKAFTEKVMLKAERKPNIPSLTLSVYSQGDGRSRRAYWEPSLSLFFCSQGDGTSWRTIFRLTQESGPTPPQRSRNGELSETAVTKSHTHPGIPLSEMQHPTEGHSHSVPAQIGRAHV